MNRLYPYVGSFVALLFLLSCSLASVIPPNQNSAPDAPQTAVPTKFAVVFSGTPDTVLPTKVASPIIVSTTVATKTVVPSQITITEFPVPAGNKNPSCGLNGITSGADGNLWFTHLFENKIGRITTSGVITLFSIPTKDSQPMAITSGTDGNVWFTSKNFGRVTPEGVIKEYPMTGVNFPSSIAFGNDGNLWFTDFTLFSSPRIGRMTPSGVITKFNLSIPASQPKPGNDSDPLASITLGSDGNLWFTEPTANKIGRITPKGEIKEFSIPRSNVNPLFIIVAPDNKFWFTELVPNKIGRMTTTGSFDEIALPDVKDGFLHLASGPDGNVWFTNETQKGGIVGRITPAGVITNFAIPTPNSGGWSITAGRDGNMWFTERQGCKIARVNLAP